MSGPIAVFIADDHPIVRQGFIKIIEQDPGFKIVGQTGDGREALEQIRTLKPDVCVLDVNMPEMTGLEVVRALDKDEANYEFVILTMYTDKEYFDEAVAMGVKGYLLKESAINDLLSCLREVHKGNHYISPSISRYLLQPAEKQAAPEEESPLDHLTASEKRVLRLIGENKTSKEIAEELFISYRTVQNHRFNICQKLGFKGHNRLLQFALEHKGDL